MRIGGIGLVASLRGLAMAMGFLLALAGPSAAGELDSLEARLVGEWIREDASSAQAYLSAQGADGTWPDIDYADRGRSNWIAASHLYRLRAMAMAFNQPGHPAYRSPAMREGVSRGVDAWFRKSPESDNWFWNQIGPQNELGPILLTMKPFLTAPQIRTGAGAFNYVTGYTGQNKVWFASQLIYRGCLLGSPADVRKGMEIVESEIRVTTEEGIQPDGSFHQHGANPYVANYGFSFLISIAPLAYAAHGLSFDFAQERRDILIRYLLDGTRWFFRRGDWVLASHGREISRPIPATTMVRDGSGEALLDALRRLLPLAGGREGEVRAFLAHVEGTEDGALVGNKHFWRSEIMVHRRSAYAASLRMTSTGTGGMESLNGENLKGGFFPFGSLFIQRSGDEYRDVRPVWDWSRIPGVTAPHSPAPKGNVRGGAAFAGGVSDGSLGAAAMDLDMHGVKGRKSWFFFDGAVVALGADLRSSGTDTVFTSINQAEARGGTWTGTSGSPEALPGGGMRRLSGRAWAFHDSVGYLFWDAGRVVVRSGKQSGSWASINVNHPSTRITREVFSLWIDHGPEPAGASYAYAVVPGLSLEEMAAYASAPEVEVLSNAADLQAARESGSGTTGAAFFAPGTVDLGSGLRLRVDAACLALARVREGRVTLSLSNPRKTALRVEADLLSGPRPGVSPAALASLVFNLPGEAAHAGKSMTQSFQIPVYTLDREPRHSPAAARRPAIRHSGNRIWIDRRDAESGTSVPLGFDGRTLGRLR